MDDKDVVYFEINNWFSGRDYPDDKTFKKWVRDQQFSDAEWCKENKLCVKFGPIDMSMNWCVTAPKSWVEENCPQLLGDGETKYTLCTYGKDVEKCVDYTKKYADFLCHPDDDGDVYGHISSWLFLEYKEENFGTTWDDSWFSDLEFDDDDEEEDDV